MPRRRQRSKKKEVQLKYRSGHQAGWLKKLRRDLAKEKKGMRPVT